VAHITCVNDAASTVYILYSVEIGGKMTMASEIRLLIWRRQSWFTLGFCPAIQLERNREKMRRPRKL